MSYVNPPAVASVSFTRHHRPLYPSRPHPPLRDPDYRWPQHLLASFNNEWPQASFHCAGPARGDIFTKSLTQEKFERFRETIRGAVTYKDMVSREIELSEQRLKTKEQQVKGKSINLMTLKTAIQEIEEFEMDCDHSWTTYSVNSNHYSTFNFTA